MLTTEQKNFLTSYRPVEKHFTSKKEIKQILEVLKPNNETRNEVVDFYDQLLDNAYIGNTRTEEYYDIMEAMMSVTAVLDFKYLQYGN
jgi:hypothetical protein